MQMAQKCRLTPVGRWTFQTTAVSFTAQPTVAISTTPSGLNRPTTLSSMQPRHPSGTGLTRSKTVKLSSSLTRLMSHPSSSSSTRRPLASESTRAILMPLPKTSVNHQPLSRWRGPRTNLNNGTKMSAFPKISRLSTTTSLISSTTIKELPRATTLR